MYIVRWLMSHPIVAIWALTIVALLLNMSGSDKKHDIETATEHAKTTMGIQQAEHIATNKTLEGVAVKTATTQDNASTNAVMATDQTAKAGSDNTQEKAISVDTDTEAGQQALSMQGLNDKSTDDLLLMAREAYWNNGLDEAAAIYQQLIQREPNVVAHKGELGNVYWKQGYPEKSAALYAEIALPMIKEGHADRVANMVGFIKLFHPEKAAKIKKMLEGLNLNP